MYLTFDSEEKSHVRTAMTQLHIITCSNICVKEAYLATKHTGFSFAMEEEPAYSNVIWIWIGRHWLKHTTEKLRICSKILFLLNILLLQFMIITFRRAPLNCRRFRHFEKIQVNSSFKKSPPPATRSWRKRFSNYYLFSRRWAENGVAKMWIVTTKANVQLSSFRLLRHFLVTVHLIKKNYGE